ncbi:MAG TPA: UbiA family prenyltransferase [Thermoanaerobaculia bacterium]|nr:UbiA family prenyltransferase [Thermoanaerobaculia bacterium]
MRAKEWWEFKLAPIFAAFYATALTLQVPVSSLWVAALTLLLALVPGAAYVSVINDLTDREEDLAAGKRNRFADGSRGLAAALVAITVAAGLAFCFLWRRDVVLPSVYLAAWLVFSLYSLPPFRWKTRGILGVLCDASGAHLFPTLLAVLLAFRAADRPVNVPWIVAVGVWAFANGIRGILWHQLTDLENDRHAGVRTFAQRHAPLFTARLGTFVAFPFELAALAAMLWQMRSAGPVVALALYFVFVALRVWVRRMSVIIVAPKPRYLIALHEYYDTWLPIALLIAASLRFPYDAIVLAIHLLVFSARTRALRDAINVLRELRHLLLKR